MRKLYRILLLWGKSAVRSLAFLPIPMMIVGLVIGIGLYYLDSQTSWTREFMESFPALKVKSQATARTILAAIAGGIITLSVFTFTQMMSLFSQVASNYSPRLLGYFTGDRSLQFSMGYYLGTIIMTLMVLLSIRSDEDNTVPNLSVITCVIFGIVGLFIFVYFVTSISSRIQIGSIILRLYELGKESVQKAHQAEHYRQSVVPAAIKDWYVIPSPIDGFIGTVDHGLLSELAAKFNTRFYVGTPKGEFLPKSFPLLESERWLNEEQTEEILSAISPESVQYHNWYVAHLKLLVEIFQKAMSPGINDPGTGLDALDRITGLLGRIMHLPVQNLYQHPDGGEVYLNVELFPDVLRNTLHRLRNYGTNDLAILRRTLQLLFHLLGEAGDNPAYRRPVHAEIVTLLRQANMNVVISADRDLLAKDTQRHRRETERYLYQMRNLRDIKRSEPGVPPPENQVTENAS